MHVCMGGRVSAMCGSDLEVAHVLTCVWNSTNVCFLVPVSQHVMYTYAHTCLLLGSPKTQFTGLVFPGEGGSFCHNPRLAEMP